VLDSLDLIEAMVAIEEDLGVLITDRDELVKAGSLSGISRLLISRCDPATVSAFAERWASVGQYSP
jgi:acyl carrier protein